MILLSGAVFLINEMLTVMLTNGQNICRSMNDSTIQVANERARPQRITQSVPFQRIINLDKPANDLLLLTTYQSATVSTQHLCFRPFSRHPLRHFPQSEACCQSLLPPRSPGTQANHWVLNDIGQYRRNRWDSNIVQTMSNHSG